MILFTCSFPAIDVSFTHKNFLPMKYFSSGSQLIHILGFISLILVLSGLTSCTYKTHNNHIRLGLVQLENGQQAVEMDSVRAMLSKFQDIDFESVELSDSNFDPNDFDILWIHQIETDTANVNSILNERSIQQLKDFQNNGGNLLLTMSATNLLQPLGLEDQFPETSTMEAKDGGYGRNLGLHAFLSHPIFDGMHGGAYLFSPKVDTVARQWGYFGDDYLPKGNVVAIDWAYIHLYENNKLVLEYTTGKGKTMAVGAYLNFAMANFNKDALELFLKNTVNYLVKSTSREDNYWRYAPPVVKQHAFQSQPVTLWKADMGDFSSIPLQHIRKASENQWDLAGERILLMGKEHGGIDEIWAHPFMALRDYTVGYRKTSQDTITWLGQKADDVLITPAAIQRTYVIEQDTLIEQIVADIKKPVSVIKYQLKNSTDIQLFVKFSTRLRLMWPYSSKVTGQIQYEWSDAANAFIFTDNSQRMTTMIGANLKPEYEICGQFDGFESKNSTIRGVATTELLASGLMQFSLKTSQNLELVIAASNEGLQNTLATYDQFAGQTEMIFQQAIDYYQNLLENTLSIQSPDPQFNEAYQWAIAGTDQFYVHTPGIGKSLVAGYATTDYGWDGNHRINGRPGYAWYFGRDGQWSGFALNDYGDFEKVKSILQQYIDFQRYDGKIYHELTTSGVVHYDAADATPLFVILAGHYLKHSGDTTFIRSNWPSIKKAIDFCFATDIDGDHLINNTLVGHGWVEGGHLFGGQTTIYLASVWGKALETASQMALLMKDQHLSEYYLQESVLVKGLINSDFWNDKTKHFNHSKNADGTYIEDVTIMPSIPLYYTQIKNGQQSVVLEKFASNNFSSDWGVRITGMDSPRFSPKGYHTGSVWPLYTGWVALAEYKNERPLQGFVHTVSNLNNYQDWGYGHVEEVLNGLEYKPSGVCAHQCWSETMALQPLIEGMLGYEPDAINHAISLSPSFPVNWDSVKVNHLKMGDVDISFEMKRDGHICKFVFVQNQGRQHPILYFSPIFEAGTEITAVECGNKSLAFAMQNKADHVKTIMSFQMKDTVIVTISYHRGLGVVPPDIRLAPGAVSQHIRVVSSELVDNQFIISTEGPGGTNQKLTISKGDYLITGVEVATIVKDLDGMLEMELSFPRSKNAKNNYTQKVVTVEVTKGF